MIGVLLYGLQLNVGPMATDAQVRELADILNQEFMMAVALGWLGTAFLFEATGIGARGAVAIHRRPRRWSAGPRRRRWRCSGCGKTGFSAARSVTWEARRSGSARGPSGDRTAGLEGCSGRAAGRDPRYRERCGRGGRVQAGGGDAGMVTMERSARARAFVETMATTEKAEH